MTIEERFQDALKRVQGLPKQPPAVLLELYGLFKQATGGDVSGKRPGRLDVKGRAKYDAWAGRAGMSQDDAKAAYADRVDALVER